MDKSGYWFSSGGPLIEVRPNRRRPWLLYLVTAVVAILNIVLTSIGVDRVLHWWLGY